MLRIISYLGFVVVSFTCKQDRKAILKVRLAVLTEELDLRIQLPELVQI